MARQVLLGAGNVGRQIERFARLPIVMNASSAGPSSVDAPTERPVDQFDEERAHGSADRTTRAPAWAPQTWPKHNVMTMRRQIENQMRHDAETNGTAQQCAAETFFDDQPCEQRGADRGPDRMRIRHVGRAECRRRCGRSPLSSCARCRDSSRPTQASSIAWTDRSIGVSETEGKRRLMSSAVAAWSTANI